MFKTIQGASLVILAAASAAQTPINGFAHTAAERFDAMAAGNYATFAGFSGKGTFSRMTTAGLMVVSPASGGFLPPVSAPNSMFGRGVIVRIRFREKFNLFGGSFRVPAGAPAGTNQMKIRFLYTGVVVGSAVAPINSLSWQWRGWDCTRINGFDEVQITGNATLAGYVGMDNLRIK